MTAPSLTLRWWNLEQTFTQTSAELEASPWPLETQAGFKAALWDVEGSTLTLTSQRPTRALLAHGLVPKQHYAALPETRHDGRWQDSEAGAALLGIAREAGLIRLTPCVWTRQTEAIRNFFEKERIAVEVETYCPHGRIFQWNTRVGMRDLLLSIPSIAGHLPHSLVCHDAAQVKTAALRLGNKDLLVKSNFALGGMGTTLLQAGADYDQYLIEAIAARLPGNAKGKKFFSWAWREEPFVVEEFIGERKTNISVTLDAYQSEAGTEIAGLSEQLIENGFSYHGIRNLGQKSITQYVPMITAIAEAIGKSLAVRRFAGWFNLDFVLTQSGRCFLVDLNVRRSAPLDLHMLVARIERQLGRDFCYQALERFETAQDSEAAINHLLETTGLAFDGTAGALPLGHPVARLDAGCTVPLLLLATDAGALEALAGDLRSVL